LRPVVEMRQFHTSDQQKLRSAKATGYRKIHCEERRRSGDVAAAANSFFVGASTPFAN
jgi:hypothetical protein